MDPAFFESLKELYRRADAAVEEAGRIRATRVEPQSKIVRETPLIGPTRCHGRRWLSPRSSAGPQGEPSLWCRRNFCRRAPALFVSFFGFRLFAKRPPMSRGFEQRCAAGIIGSLLGLLLAFRGVLKALEGRLHCALRLLVVGSAGYS